MIAIEIRPFRSEDASDLVGLFRSSARQAASRDYSRSQLQAWAPEQIDEAAFAARCMAKDTWVAEVDQRVRGFSDLEGDGHIDMLYVHPAFQRRGIARALLAHIERTARSRGLRRLYTESSVTARCAFMACGFAELGPQTVTRRGERFTNFRMEKLL